MLRLVQRYALFDDYKLEDSCQIPEAQSQLSKFKCDVTRCASCADQDQRSSDGMPRPSGTFLWRPSPGCSPGGSFALSREKSLRVASQSGVVLHDVRCGCAPCTAERRIPLLAGLSQNDGEWAGSSRLLMSITSLLSVTRIKFDAI
eukprot:2559654-Pleurochrysis_carterae.AAC.1